MLFINIASNANSVVFTHADIFVLFLFNMPVDVGDIHI